MTDRSNRHHLAMIAFLALVGVMAASQAHARPELLRWAHPSPGQVQDFEARVRSADGSGELILSLSVPPLQGGIFETTIEVGDGNKLIALRAIGPGGVQSAWSSERFRADPSGSGSGGGGSSGGGGGGSGGGSGGSDVVPVGAGTPLSPTPGATQRFDFTSASDGSSVAPWVDTRFNYSLQTDDALFGVTSLGSNRVLFTDSSENNIHSHADGNSNIWGDYEVRGRMAIDRPSASIGVTTYSQYRTRDAYYRLGSSNGGPFVIEGRPALSCSNSGNLVTPTPGEWYRFELDVQDMGSNNRVRAKVWRQGDAQPSGYALSCTDSSAQRPSGGRIGVWASGTGSKYWDDFEVVLGQGSGSAEPPAPPVLIQVVPAAP